MKRIILDTNIIMAPAELHVDVYEELRRVCDFPYELWTVRPVMDELESLAHGDGKVARAARTGITLMASKGVRILEGDAKVKNADEFILAIVQRDRDLVCTADRGLRRALKERGIPRIALRKRRVLEIRGQ